VPQERFPAGVQAGAKTEQTRQFVRQVRRVTRRSFTPEEKVRILLEGFQQEPTTEPEGTNLVIRSLLVNDYPIILRFSGGTFS
jgi:hypothetical protein